jgi:hypothetical protein
LKTVGRWALASVGPLAETEKVAGKEGRAQDIGGDVTEGEAGVEALRCGNRERAYVGVGVCEEREKLKTEN